MAEHWSFTRSDLKLLRQGARRNWGIPDELRNEVLYRCAEIIAEAGGDTLREQLAAMRLLIQADRNDLAAEALELKRQQAAAGEASEGKSVAELVLEMQAAGELHERDQERAGAVPGRPGPVQPDDPR